jgi:DNA invertase Pin-like site-specific DNA recombinase
LTLHILAAVAEHEREMISARTSAALQAAKGRGVRLGNPRPTEAAALASAAVKAAADQFAANVLPIIRELQASGVKSRAALAEALNARKVPTARGGAWSHVQVGAILARA